jgi:hypothetical protein
VTAPGFDGVQTRVAVSDSPHALCTHCDGSGREPAPGRLLLSLTLPIKTVSEANSRGRWQKGGGRKAKQRKAVRAALDAWKAADVDRGRPAMGRVFAAGGIELHAWDVLLTRITPSSRGLDPGDNLPMSQKAVRDEIATWLGVDDRDPRVGWSYAQEKGPKLYYGVRIEIRERRAP